MKKTSPNGGELSVIYEPNTRDISSLEGKVLTLVEAVIGDLEQRRAVKDMFRQLIWEWATSLPKCHIQTQVQQTVLAITDEAERQLKARGDSERISPTWIFERLRQIAEGRGDQESIN